MAEKSIQDLINVMTKQNEISDAKQALEQKKAVEELKDLKKQSAEFEKARTKKGKKVNDMRSNAAKLEKAALDIKIQESEINVEKLNVAKTTKSDAVIDINAQKQMLETMKESIEAQGGIAEDNEKYQEASKDLQIQEIDARLNAGGLAKGKEEELKKERDQLNKNDQTLLEKISSGIMGIGSSFKEGAKAKLAGASKGLKAMLAGTAFAALGLALGAFLNSKKFIEMVDILVKVGKFLKDVFLPPIKKVFAAVKKLFSGIIDAFKMFSEGDILGGITKLFLSIGTFIFDMFDVAITNLFNVLGSIFGFEGTDSVFGSIMKFFTNIKDFVVDLFDFSDMSLFDGFMKLIDIVFLPLNLAINFLKGLFNFGDPDVPFKLSDFLFGPEGIISKAIQAIKDIFPSFADLKAMLPSVGDFLKSINPFSNSDDEVEGRAEGGSVEAGQPYVVGERGQELFVPNQPGQIVNAQRTAEMMKGGSGGNGGGGTSIVVAPTNISSSNSSSTTSSGVSYIGNPDPIFQRASSYAI
jgi:hypothetical protein